MRKLIYFLLLIVSVVLFGCNKSNPTIPAYIQVDSIQLTHEENPIGISDVWVNVDGENLGVYGLPATFPILKNGPATITLSPGIKVNGMSATRSPYSFYTSYKQEVQLNPGEIKKFSPTLDFFSWVDIPFSENFENAGIAFTRDPSIEYKFEQNSTVYFEKKYSGAIFLESTRNLFEEVSIEQLATGINMGSSGLFLELNFNSEMIIAVALYVSDGGQVEPVELVHLLPTDGEWSKIYIDMYNPLINYPPNTPYKLVFSNIDYLYNTVIEQPLKLDAKIFIDDIKIVQQKN